MTVVHEWVSEVGYYWRVVRKSRHLLSIETRTSVDSPWSEIEGSHPIAAEIIQLKNFPFNWRLSVD